MLYQEFIDGEKKNISVYNVNILESIRKYDKKIFMKKILLTLFSLIFFFILLIGLIMYARGYRINFSQKNITSTGIIVASSYPDGAKIYINNVLKGATNSTVALTPGTYFIEIKKTGYSSWSKQIKIKGEVVFKVEALLFPQNPSLSPLTSLGIQKAVFSEKDSYVIIFSSLDDTKKDGIYLLDTSKKTISIFNPLKLLTLKSAFPRSLNFKTADVLFSPDGKQIIVSFFDINERPTQNTYRASYLLSTTEQTFEPFDITRSKNTIEQSWNEQAEEKKKKILAIVRDPFPQIASASMNIISFSPDDSKILYQAKEHAILPPLIIPRLIGTNQTPENRTLQKNHLYIYDKKEDKNFEMNLSTFNFGLLTFDSILWYPDSQHIVINEGKTITVVDYDGQNKQTVYSGPHESSFFAITPDGRILILANLNPEMNNYPDMYAVGIR